MFDKEEIFLYNKAKTKEKSMEQFALAEGERILASTRRSWLALLSAVVWSGFIGGIFVSIGLILHFVVADEESVEGSLKTFVDVLTYLCYVLGGFIFLMMMLRAIVAIKQDCLVLTNKRLYGRKGFIVKSTYDTVLEKIDTIRVENSLEGKIFHFATIEVVSPASMRLVKGTTVYDKYDYISNTDEFRKAVLTAIDEAKEGQAREQSQTARKQ